mgnify:CR=1 FL=1
MADYKEFYEARKEIIDIVKKDLIGPVYEDEILVERPTQYYVMGKLYPRAKDEQDKEHRIVAELLHRQQFLEPDEGVEAEDHDARKHEQTVHWRPQTLLIQVLWVLLLQ